jgi:hypothetical protein
MTLGCELSYETLGDPLSVGDVAGKRSDCSFRQAGFATDCRMGVEFVIRFPYRPDCEDHHLKDSFTQRYVPCLCSLEIGKTGGHFGRKQDRIERSEQLPIRGLPLKVSGLGPRNHRRISAIVNFPLCFRQFIRIDKRKATAEVVGLHFETLLFQANDVQMNIEGHKGQ